jgi:hypothetical protein
MDYSSIYVDKLAAEEHRQELEEQARIERMIAENTPHSNKKRFGIIRRLLHLRQPDQPADDHARRN